MIYHYIYDPTQRSGYSYDTSRSMSLRALYCVKPSAKLLPSGMEKEVMAFLTRQLPSNHDG